MYVDGVETECNLIPHGRSKYNATKATIRVGTKKKDGDDEDDEDEEDEDSGSKKKKKSEDTDTEAPTTEAPATEAPATDAPAEPTPEGAANVVGKAGNRSKYAGYSDYMRKYGWPAWRSDV